MDVRYINRAMSMENPEYRDDESFESEQHLEEQATPLTPEGRLVCYITGQLRKETPEELVRQEWARKLVEEYGYPKDDLDIEVTIPIGTKTT